MPKKNIPAETADMNEATDIEMTMPETDQAGSAYDPEYWEERVEWFVPLDVTNPHDRTLLIMVNGHYFKMMRGTRVKVPRYVIEEYNGQQAQMVSLIIQQEELEKMVNLTD